jgi:hypothetical protein
MLDKFGTPVPPAVRTNVLTNISTHEIGHASGHTNPRHINDVDDLMYEKATAPLWGTTILIFNRASANQIRRELGWPEL